MGATDESTSARGVWPAVIGTVVVIVVIVAVVLVRRRRGRAEEQS